MPSLAKGEKVVLDFASVDSVTQSFVHALISDTFREYGIDVLNSISFKNCNDTVRGIIEIVVDYMQEVD